MPGVCVLLLTINSSLPSPPINFRVSLALWESEREEHIRRNMELKRRTRERRTSSPRLNLKVPREPDDSPWYGQKHRTRKSVTREFCLFHSHWQPFPYLSHYLTKQV
ncbi:hypothetical protein BDN67DRAFT_968255 [Paxillus ammoniavirescens]|nr:hypothetical protein BDN67DRAFT_968255 [Paxillus ammoniavirescens]